jgi:hypothetical protein
MSAAAAADHCPADLESALALAETELAALGLALKTHDAAAIETATLALRSALARVVDSGERAAGAGRLPASVRRRLKAASSLMTAQRQAVARNGSSVDRAIGILLPVPEHGAAALYGAHGGAERERSSGLTQA